MTDSGIRTHYFWLPNCVGLPQARIMQDTNVSADDNARDG